MRINITKFIKRIYLSKEKKKIEKKLQQRQHRAVNRIIRALIVGSLDYERNEYEKRLKKQTVWIIGAKDNPQLNEHGEWDEFVEIQNSLCV